MRGSVLSSSGFGTLSALRAMIASSFSHQSEFLIVLISLPQAFCHSFGGSESRLFTSSAGAEFPMGEGVRSRRSGGSSVLARGRGFRYTLVRRSNLLSLFCRSL